jgi:hypothetical protein
VAETPFEAGAAEPAMASAGSPIVKTSTAIIVITASRGKQSFAYEHFHLPVISKQTIMLNLQTEVARQIDPYQKRLN